MENACGVYVRSMSFEEDEWKAYILITFGKGDMQIQRPVIITRKSTRLDKEKTKT